MENNMQSCRNKETISWNNCDYTGPLDSEGMCILHSLNKEKDKTAFEAALKAKLDRKNYHFNGVCFPYRISFSKQNFEEQVFFSSAIFLDEVDFSRAEFSKRTDFSKARFYNAVDFLHCKFLDMVSFSKTEFDKKADFSGSEFFGNVIFRKAKFWFPGFSMAKFLANADFSSSEFIKNAYFRRTEFNGITDFDEAIFFDKANFTEVIFKGLTSFIKTNFLGILTCSHAKIFGKTFFDSINSGEKFNANPFVADFNGIDIERKSLQFRNLSLAEVIFIGTDLRLVKFSNVKWARYWWRNILWEEQILSMRRNSRISRNIARTAFLAEVLPSEDEIKPTIPTNEEYVLVEGLYRQLKLNCEEEGDFKRLGDFHYGEMEMHRRGNPWWRRWFSWYPFYWALSGYGERPLRAFIWLLLLIPAWAGLVWGLGINQAGSQTPINYWDTLLFILEKATLQRPAWPEGINWLGKLLGSLSVLLLPGQAALFILALRNRLGRRR